MSFGQPPSHIQPVPTCSICKAALRRKRYNGAVRFNGVNMVECLYCEHCDPEVSDD